MGGVNDGELIRLRGFPGGVNNVTPENDLPKDENGSPLALREGVNVDLHGPSFKPRRRKGRTKLVEGRFHSPAAFRNGNTLFAVRDGDLIELDTRGSVIRTVRSGVGQRYLSWTEAGSDLFYSSPSELRRIRREDGADLPGWINATGIPDAQPFADGGMPGGTYQVAMTWFDEGGRESGSLGMAEVTLQPDEGIELRNIPVAPEGAVKARAYITPPDGGDPEADEVGDLYAAKDFDPSVSSVRITGYAWEGGRALETLFCQTLPPCQILRHWNGRLLGASGNQAVWSAPGRLGLTTLDNYFRLGREITLMEPVGEGGDGAGVWFADHARTYWFEGGNPKDWRKVIRYDHGAVKRTSTLVKGTDIGLETTQMVAFWLAANGTFMAGLPGGQLVPITEGRYAANGLDEGAVLFRAQEGLRQMLVTAITSGRNGFAIGDHASATVIRHTG